MKKLKWLLTKIFGRKYFIEYTNDLGKDEILVLGHKIYLRKDKK